MYFALTVLESHSEYGLSLDAAGLRLGAEIPLMYWCRSEPPARYRQRWGDAGSPELCEYGGYQLEVDVHGRLIASAPPLKPPT